jgi:hypothetical protein
VQKETYQRFYLLLLNELRVVAAPLDWHLWRFLAEFAQQDLWRKAFEHSIQFLKIEVVLELSELTNIHKIKIP